MSKRLDRIHNYRYPVSQPTVFDEQELTVLELASRNASKTNEIIDYINTWLKGELTKSILEMINKTFVDVMYDEENETVIIKIKGDIIDG